MWIRLSLLAFVSWMLSWPLSETSPKFDLLITDARVVDGCGNPWYLADVGIRDGLIVAVGNLGGHPTSNTIHANRLVLAPGFIDMMGTSTLPLLLDPIT